MKYYKVDPQSEYYKDLLKAREGQEKILDLSVQVRKEFGLPEHHLSSISPDKFYQPKDATPEEFAKQFKKDGFARKDSVISKRFVALAKEAGLTDLKDDRFINFIYGILRSSSSQTLRRTALADTDYIESNVDFSDSELAHLIEIPHSEFLEVQLKVAKEKEASS